MMKLGYSKRTLFVGKEHLIDVYDEINLICPQTITICDTRWEESNVHIMQFKMTYKQWRVLIGILNIKRVFDDTQIPETIENEVYCTD